LSGPNEPGGPGDDDLELPDEIDLDDPPEDQEPEPDDVVEVDETEEPEPPPQRQEQRQTRRERQSDNWRTKAEAAERDREYWRNEALRRNTPQAPAPDPYAAQRRQQEEDERISLLPPNEQVAAYRQIVQRETALARLEAFDTNDRSSFQTLGRNYPAAQRLAPQVEQVLQAQRQAGVYHFSREQIFHYLYGQEAFNKATQNTGRQRAQGQRNVARQTVRPTGGSRGDTAQTTGRRGNQDSEDDRILRNTNLRDL
jgi:hypothetical protein